MSGVHNEEQAKKEGKEQITNEELAAAGRGPMAGDTSGGEAKADKSE